MTTDRTRRRTGPVRALAAPLAGLALLLAPARGRADDVRADMHAYFAGEKRESLIFLAFGVASMGAGAGLATRGDPLPRAAGITLASFGLVQAAGAIYYYLSIAPRVRSLDAQISADPAAFRRDELARIGGVNDRFVAFRYTEMALIAGGLGLVAVGHNNDSRASMGVGLGLSLQAALLLGLDVFAERRSHAYTDALRRFSPARAFFAPVPSGAVVGLRGELD